MGRAIFVYDLTKKEQQEEMPNLNIVFSNLPL
jgi:hypothetical protein